MPAAIPILLMARQLTIGGSERQLAETARSMDRVRFEPHVGTFVPGGFRAEELKAAGVPVVSFGMTSFLRPAMARAARRLAHYVNGNGIRLVHSFDTPANVFATPVVRGFTSARLLTSQRAYRSLVNGANLHLLRLSDHLADGIVVNCQAVRRHLMEDERVPPSQIEVCYNGIDLDVFRPCPGGTRQPALREAPLVVGSLCALRPEKNLETLLEAFARARPARPGVRLAIVGSGGCLPDLQGRAARLGLAGHCLFQPATSEAAAWLRSIDIFVLPSLTEAFSNSLMEAMACGCCAVASRVGGNPELVADGETGLLFEPGDVAGLEAALRRLMTDDGLRRRLAASGTRFLQSFTVAAAARRMEGIYSRRIGVI